LLAAFRKLSSDLLEKIAFVATLLLIWKMFGTGDLTRINTLALSTARIGTKLLELIGYESATDPFRRFSSNNMRLEVA